MAAGKFKGTKGLWEIVQTIDHPENKGEQISFIQTPKVCFNICAVEIDTFTRVEFQANAQLISKAPEMLEFLENLENDNHSIPPHMWDWRNRLIKEVTEI